MSYKKVVQSAKQKQTWRVKLDPLTVSADPSGNLL